MILVSGRMGHVGIHVVGQKQVDLRVEPVIGFLDLRDRQIEAPVGKPHLLANLRALLPHCKA